MNDLLIKLLNMSLTAGMLALAVMLVRLIFKKMPKKINVFLWALVGLRLLLPFSIQSPLSLMPDSEPLRQEYFGLSAPAFPAVENTDEWTTVGISKEYDDVYPTVPVDSDGTAMGKKPFPVLPAVWFSGVGAMLLYAAVSYLKIKRQTSASLEKEKGVYLCDDIGTPFILGIVKPKIYIPSSLNEAQRTFVLSHEKAHIKRLDYVWKPLGFLLLSVYWFNPVLWLSYILLCRDIELACDEKVIQNMENAEKADYSQALLDCSLPRRSVAACPLAFGETGVKTRVKNILNYKKPAFWVILAAVLVCAALAVFFLTDPVKKEDTSEPTSNGLIAREYGIEDFDEKPEPKASLEEAIHEVLLKRHRGSYRGECLTEGHVTLGTEKKNDTVRVWLLTNVCSYGFQNGYFTDVGGSSVPTVLVFREDNGMYVLEQCLETEDGGLLADSIKDLFPLRYRSRVLTENQDDHKAMYDQFTEQAEAYLEANGRAEAIRPWNEVPHYLLSDVGISVEVQEKIFDAMSYIPHYEYLGFEDCPENGVRYIYRTEYKEEQNAVVFTKVNCETHETLYTYVFDAATGEPMANRVNVDFAEGVRFLSDDPCQAQLLLSGIASVLDKEYCSEGECCLVTITKAEMVPLGMAGLNEGINVYETEYSVIRTRDGGEGELAGSVETGRKEFSGYSFIYWNNSDNNVTFAGAMTYDEIKDAFLNEENAEDDEALLITAAAYYIELLRPAQDAG